MLAETTVQGGHVSHGNDRGSYVRFYKYVERGQLSESIMDFVEIITPGDTKSEMRRQVQDSDKVRWPEAWAAYQAGEQSKITGYPLEQWPGVDEGMIRDWNHKRIYTVEQLAGLSDSSIESLGFGTRTYVAKAKAFLDVMAKTGDATKYAAQFESIKAENELLQEENRKLASRLQALEDRLTEEPKKTLTLPGKK